MPPQNPHPRYAGPDSMGYRGYSTRLRHYNTSLSRRVGKLIASHISSTPADYAYATTGSDGRLEKGPQSLVELMLLHKDGFPVRESVGELLEFLEDRIPGIVFQVAEVKRIDDGNQKLSEYAINRTQLYPTRIMDAALVYGDSGMLNEAKTALVAELKTPFGSRVMQHVNNERRRANTITRTGAAPFKGAPVKHFDLEEGLSFYDNAESNGAMKGSFKYGPLRLIQYRLAKDLIALFRDPNKADIEINEIPTNIPERLFFFDAEGLSNLPSSAVEGVADSYRYFLWQFHRSQENFRLNGRTVTEFDRAEVKERLEDLITRTETPII